MLSFFTIPKPFRGHIGTIQRNAILSWRKIFPEADILLLGNEEGMADFAGSANVRHIPELSRNSYGTPLLDSAFRIAETQAAHPWLCYVNTDIVLTTSFRRAVEAIPLPRFLLVGRRTDLDVTEAVAFETGWEGDLLERAEREGRLQHPWACDFFLFPKHCGLGDIPPFAVGRPNWDNWLIYRARTLSLPVVDLTQACIVIHQNHDYRHVPQARGKLWHGPEGDENRRLAGGAFRSSILDATHRLEDKRLHRNTVLRKIAMRLGHALHKRLPEGVKRRVTPHLA